MLKMKFRFWVHLTILCCVQNYLFGDLIMQRDIKKRLKAEKKIGYFSPLEKSLEILYELYRKYF